MMTINERAKEIHALAIAKGWWETDRPFSETIPLIHSELSEALEQYRDGNPMLWYQCDAEDGIEHKKCTQCIGDGWIDCPSRSQKPEGIAVELVDCVIRILDYAGKTGFDIDASIKEHKTDLDTNMLTKLLSECHKCITMAYSEHNANTGKEQTWFAECIRNIMNWSSGRFDFWEIVALKHEYNKTRPHKHGGKVC